MKRLEQDVDRRLAEADGADEKLVDQLVGQLIDEVTLPVVTILSVRRVELELLLEERPSSDRVAHEPGRGAQPAQAARDRDSEPV